MEKGSACSPQFQTIPQTDRSVQITSDQKHAHYLHTNQVSTISCGLITWRMKKVTTGLMETGNAGTILTMFDMVRSFCVGKMYYARNGDGKSFMHKYWYNNHHIKVTVESRGDMLCGPLTTTWKSMQVMMNFTGWWKCTVMSLMLLSNKYQGSYSGDMIIGARLQFDK